MTREAHPPALSGPRQIAGGLALGAGMVSGAVLTMRPLVLGMKDPSAANTLVASVVVLLAGTAVAKAVVEGGFVLPPACVTAPLGFLLFLGLLQTVFAMHVWPAEVQLFTWITHSLVFLATYALLARHTVYEIGDEAEHTTPEERDGMGRVMVAAVLATAAAVALCGVYQRYAVLPHLAEEASDSLAGRALLANPLGRSRIHALEVFGPFVGTSNAMAAYMALLLPLALGFGVAAHRAGRRIAAVAGWATAGLVVYVLVLTKSTGGAVAALAGVSAAAAFHWRRAIADRFDALLPKKARTGGADRAAVLVVIKRCALVAGGVLIAATLVVIAFAVLARTSLTMRVRAGYWHTSLAMIADRPLGVGLGNFGEHYAFYKTPAGWETREAHNVFLSLAAEAGLAAVVALLFLVRGFLRATLRPRVFRAGGSDAGLPARPEQVLGNADVPPEVATVNNLRALGLVGGLTALVICIVSGPWLGAGLPGRQTAPEYVMTAVIFAVWAAVFWSASDTDVRSDVVCAGVAGGLAAVLVHGQVDFTFRVKGIMFTSAALGAAALAISEGESLRVRLRGLRGFAVSTAVAFSLAFVLWRGVSRPMRLAWHSENAEAGVEWAARLDRTRYAVRAALAGLPTRLPTGGRTVDRGRLREVLSGIREPVVSGAADGLRVALDSGTDAAVREAARQFAGELENHATDSVRRAWQFLEKYVDEEPGDERMVLMLAGVGGDLHRRKPEIETDRVVEEALRRLAELSPVSFVPRKGLGELLARQGHLAEAAAAFEKAAALYPEKPELWLRAGDARAFTDPEKAVRAYRRALEANRLAEDERTLLYSRFWSQTPKRPPSPDFPHRLDEIDAQVGPSAEVAFRRALAYAEIGGFDESVNAIDRALALRPGDVQLCLFRAIFLDMEAARAGTPEAEVVARAGWDAVARMLASAPAEKRISGYTLALARSRRERMRRAAGGDAR